MFIGAPGHWRFNIPVGTKNYVNKLQCPTRPVILLILRIMYCSAVLRSATMDSIVRSLVFFAWLAAPALAGGQALAGGLVTHNDSFVPDHILRITAQNISQACNTRYSAVVNGTSPGPAIRLKAGQSAWIRVYNDVHDSNLTMASLPTI